MARKPKGSGSGKEKYTMIRADWNIPYLHSAGKHATKFFQEIKDNKRIMGSRCPRCKKVLIPPRSFCERCFVPTAGWVEVSDKGKIEAVSINYMEYEGLPKPPYAIAFIRLDGADSCLMHFVGGVDLKNVEKAKDRVKIGTEVKAVWKDKGKREGRMTDIHYFKPV